MVALVSTSEHGAPTLGPEPRTDGGTLIVESLAARWAPTFKRAALITVSSATILGAAWRGLAFQLGPVEAKTATVSEVASEARAASAANAAALIRHVDDEQSHNARRDERDLHFERHLIRIEGALRIKPDPDAPEDAVP